VVTWKTGWERIRSYAGMEVEDPRRLERLIVGAAAAQQGCDAAAAAASVIRRS